MDERLRFVARLLNGEKMAPPWAGYGKHAPRVSPESEDCTQTAQSGSPRPEKVEPRHGFESPSGGRICWASGNRAYRPRGVKTQRDTARVTCHTRCDTGRHV